jgi:hypothetical protein
MTRIEIRPFTGNVLRLGIDVLVVTYCGAFRRDYLLSWHECVAMLKATPAEGITVELR